MPHLFLIGFVYIALCASLTAQSSSPQTIDVYFKYGNPDFLDLSGQKVLPAGNKVFVENLESFAIGYSAWNLMGEFASSPSFYYALNSDHLKGSGSPIYYKVISKYPDLAKRYQAIRPASVNIKLNVQLKLNYDTTLRPVSFRITNNDLVYFESRSGKNFKSPGSPKRWQDAFSNDQTSNAFTAANSSDERVLIELLKKQIEVLPAVGGNSVTIDVKWNVGEIDEIGRLYEQYEKENKKIGDELKAVKNADKLINPVAAYDKDDEMSAPFEEEAKSAEVFKDGETVGLRAKGKIVFQSRNYSDAEPFRSLNKLFKLRSKDEYSYHIYNEKGKRLSVDGHSVFQRIEAGTRPGTYQLLSKQEGKQAFCTTEDTYRGKELNVNTGYYTQSEFDDFVKRDKKSSARQTSSTRQTSSIPPSYSNCTNCVELAFSLPPLSAEDYYRGTLYTVNEKPEILSSETVYY